MMIIKIALRNLLSNWKHSIAASIAISSGFISLCLYQGYMDDVQRLYLMAFSEGKMYGDIMVENSLYSKKEGKTNPLKYSLTKDEQNKLDNFFRKSEDYIKGHAKFLNVKGMISNSNESSIFIGKGYDLAEGLRIRGSGWAWDAMYGKPLTIGKKDELHVGYTLAKFLGCDLPKLKSFYVVGSGYKKEVRPFTCKRNDLQLIAATEHKQMNALDLNVVGIVDASYKEIDSRFVQMSLETAQSLLDTDKVSYYVVSLKDRKDFNRFMQDFNKFNQDEKLNLTASLWTKHEVGSLYVSTMELLSLFRNFIILVILFIVGFSIFNTFIKIVKERTKEIGTLRSLGFSKLYVMSIFISESILLAISGSIIGGILSWIFSTITNSLAITYNAGGLSQPVLLGILISPELVLKCFAILLFLSLFACFISMKETFKKTIVECLIVH